jgi:uncharacterized protein YfaS (alpha-2-macroglobulin family)
MEGTRRAPGSFEGHRAGPAVWSSDTAYAGNMEALMKGGRAAWGVGLSVAFLLCALCAQAEVQGLQLSFKGDQVSSRAEEGVWAVRLGFDHPVAPQALVAALDVSVQGKPKKFTLTDPRFDEPAKDPAKDFRLTLEEVPDGTVQLRVGVKKGLSDASGRRVLRADQAHTFTFAVPRVKVTHMSTFFQSAKDKGVRLEFSRDVSPGELKSVLEVTPSVDGLDVVSAGPGRVNLLGRFKYDEQYRLLIPTVKLHKGRVLLLGGTWEFKAPGVKPQVSIRTKRFTIERKGRQLFPVTLENLSKVKAAVTRIPPFLAPEALEEAGGAKLDEVLSRIAAQRTSLNDSVKTGRIPAVFGGEITSRAEVFFAPEARENVLGFTLPLSFRTAPEKGGVMALEFTDPDAVFKEKTQTVVQVTDLSISYKISSKTLLLWVTSLYSGKPVQGARIMLTSTEGARFFAGTTDENGILTLKSGASLPMLERPGAAVKKEKLDLENLKWACAATSDDAGFIALDDQELKPHGFRRVVSVDAPPQGIRGQIFTERGVYRPGEKVFFKCAARSYLDGKIESPRGRRVRVTVFGPREDVVYDRELTFSEFGTCHDSLTPGPNAPVGPYVIKGVVKSESGLDEEFSHTFRVEEYKRPRHFVSLTFSGVRRESKALVGVEGGEEWVKVEALAAYYTGGPVKHGKARWKAVLVPVTQKVEGYEDYLFGNSEKTEQFLESGEATLDHEGRLVMTLPLDARALNGLFGMRLSVTVVDVDGEPATDVGMYRVKPKYRVGVSAHPQRVQPGSQHTLKVIVVDSKGDRVQSGEIKTAVMNRRSFRVQKRDDSGNIRYLWEQGWMAASSDVLALENGEAEFNVTTQGYGEMMVAFTFEEGGRLYASRTVFDVGRDYTRYGRDDEEDVSQSVEEMKPSLDKSEYKPGEEAVAQFSADRPLSTCLVTVEQGDILEYRVIPMEGQRGSFEFTVGPEHQPNAYICALGVSGREGFPDYPSQTDAYTPSVHYGYAMVKVRQEVRSLNLEIAPDTPELTARPGERATLSFEVKDHEGKGVKSELAVCVADEAVLALTRFETPDLSGLKEFIVPLAVFGGDLRTALITQEIGKLLAVKPLTGGGSGAGVVGPSVRKDFRPVAFFDPAVVTDDKGRARVEFNLPDSTTAYRVYAVACDKTVGFASGHRQMIVRKEFSVDPSFPRFLTPMDKAVFPITTFNKTDAAGEVNLEAKGSSGIEVRLPQPTFSLGPMSSPTLFGEVEAVGGVDRASMVVSGLFKSATTKFDDAVEKIIPIRSRFLPVRRFVVGSFRGKGEIKTSLPKELTKLSPRDLAPEDLKATLSVGATNWARIAPALKYLLHYPYGCIEQSASGVAALAGVRELVKTGFIPGLREDVVDAYLKSGVGRIMSMQLNDGSFSYWPGNREQTWWGTLYAVWALTCAQQAGIEVPERGFARSLDFVRAQLIQRGGSSSSPTRDPWVTELGVYSLAENGKLNAAELKPFLDKFNSASAFGRALLLQAAKRTCALPHDEILRRLDELQPPSDRECPYYFNSGNRATASCLLAALESGGAEKRRDSWAGTLLQGLGPEGRWRSTADTGWCLLALSKYFHGQTPSHNTETTVRIKYAEEDAVEVRMGRTPTEIELDFAKLLEKGTLKLDATRDGRSEGAGLAHYTLSLTYPDVTSQGGEVARGLGLQKRIENLNGASEIRVGDVVRVTLDLDVSPDRVVEGYRHVEYVAVEDPVPAGLVPINSELAGEGVMGGSGGADNQEGRYSYDLYPSHFEFRDDGVRVFKNRMWPGVHRFSYLARASFAGDFWMRGSRAALMYEPEVFALTEGKRLSILPADK